MSVIFKVNDWKGCYPSDWKGKIVPEAFSHPAKYSSRLIERIYKHMGEMGWLKEGDTVIDPFGGVALGAFVALRYGLNWSGVELEQNFVRIGNDNIALWNERYSGKLPRWGRAVLRQGDSRQLVQLFSGGDELISSPPYANGCAHEGGNDPRPEKMQGGEYHGVGLNGVLSSPPYASSPVSPQNVGNKIKDRLKDGKTISDHSQEGYGSTPGQLGAMPVGDFDGVVSSPPFLQTQGGVNVTSVDGPLSDPALIERHRAGNHAAGGYGRSQGQLGSMPEGNFDASVISPPFEDCVPVDDKHFALNDGRKTPPQGQGGYGTSEGKLGQEHGDTFWASSRLIVEQTYQLLAPGAHAVWVVKRYVKNGELVDFPRQWRELCEAVGFDTEHEHHALLVRRRGVSYTLDGDAVEHVTSSKSFFRRMLEKKGAPPIDWETVLCMRKGGNK